LKKKDENEEFVVADVEVAEVLGKNLSLVFTSADLANRPIPELKQNIFRQC